ncbi:MAG: FHA domain-containing protein [Deltaproteobacteria bacterium]|nr:FHA domain-containing protein [Deltaproteobacteria bacterium]
MSVPLRFTIRNPRRALCAAEHADVSTHEVEAVCEGGEVVFGRARGAGIELPFPKVSARHVRLVRHAGGYRVEDLGSTNGTHLAGRRLAPHAPEAIAVGQAFEIGGVEVRFLGETSGTAPIPARASSDTLARRLVHDIFEACPPAECARLLVLSGPEQGHELALAASGRTFKVGRGEGCDLVLSGEDISREHAAFERCAGGIVVRDLGSKNGVEVGGERLAGARGLGDGEVIAIGETRLQLLDPEDRYLRQIQAAERDEAMGETEPAPVDAAAPGGAGAPQTSRLPAVASAIAALALLAVLGLLLALFFGQ